MKIHNVITAFLGSVNLGSAALNAVEPAKMQSGCDGPVALDAKTNIFLNYTLHTDSLWHKFASSAAENITDVELKRRAVKASNVGTFVWLEKPADIWRIEKESQDVPCNHVLGLVLAGLPYRECLASGTPPDDDPWSYEDLFLQPVVEAIQVRPNIPFVVIVEPGVIGTVGTNTQTTCEHVRRSWRHNVPLALKRLDLPNVITYLDAAHGGWFGWRDKQKAGAREVSDTWKNAGPLKQFRGIAVNVANYNSWDNSPGEMFQGENTCFDLENPARNEKRYLQLMQKWIGQLNISMPLNGIMDTSRSGVQGVRCHWEDWCNVNYTGFGQRGIPAAKDTTMDILAWIKWGGISDGTSNSGAPTYNPYCGRVDAFSPMPEKGEFSLSYFEMLLSNWKGWAATKKSFQYRCEKIESLEVKRCGQ